MNYEEQQQYNKLSESDKRYYNKIKSEHPYWNHKQTMIKVAFNHKEDEIIERAGHNIDSEDSEILSGIFQGVRNFLKRAGVIAQEVFNALDQLIEIVKRGKAIYNAFREIWDWLTDH